MGIVQTLPFVANWSLTRLPGPLIYAAAMVGVIPLVGYIRRLPKLPLIGWTPVALAVPMLLGLFHHILVRIALDGSGLGTPGWYLNVIAPALAFALALGWKAPAVTSALAIYSMLYALAATVWELSLFSGCAGKGEGGLYTRVGSSCFIDPHVLFALGHPIAGAVWVVLAFALGVAALVIAKPWLAVMNAQSEADPEALTPLF